jgi:pilus assembly protein Flp/PilA
MMERFFLNETGQGAVEYSLIILLVALVVIGGITLIGTNASAFFKTASEKFK